MKSKLLFLRSLYFLAKNRIPHTTTFEGLVQLQVANGDEILKQHIEQGPSMHGTPLPFIREQIFTDKIFMVAREVRIVRSL